MTVTLKDISKITGVNTGTISQVLNRHPKGDVVRDDTKKRIFAAARKLGYQRNELAATTRTGVNNTIALIGDFEKRRTFYINEIISGILTSATQNRHGVKVYSVEQLKQCFGEILSYRMKSVIVISMSKEYREQIADFCKKHELKLVYVLEQSCGFFPTVVSADRIAMRDAVTELVGLGHKRIALICSVHNNFHYKDERHAGYLEGLKLAGIDADQNLIDCSRYDNDCLVFIRRMLNLAKENRPTAFLCIADSRAAQAINQIIKSGLKVPEDISVIGFGNTDICSSLIVPLTSIAQPFKAIGTAALKLVLGKDCGVEADSGNEYLLRTELINRESVAICKNK